MANYQTLKDQIKESIKTNGKGEITGQILQDTLISIVDNIEKSINISSKVNQNTIIINDCQDSSRYTLSNGVIDEENKILWNQSLHITNGNVRFTKDTFDLQNNYLVVRLKINSLESGSSIFVKIGSLEDQTTKYTYEIMREHVNTIYGEWQEFTIPWAAYQYKSGTNDIDLSKIQDVFVIAQTGDFNIQYIGLKPNNLKKGIVTFAFDDGWKTQSDGIKALAEKGLSGTMFVIKEAIEGGTANYLNMTELQELVNLYNTDIEVHGGNSFDDKEDEELITYLSDSKQLLINNGLSQGNYMAYPNGFHSPRVVQISKRFFTACRTIQAYIPLESYPPYDNYRIRAITAITSSYVDKIKEYIDKSCECGGWIILVFHKIDDGTGAESCSLEAFKEIVDYAYNSDANVLNFKQVFELSNNL